MMNLKNLPTFVLIVLSLFAFATTPIFGADCDSVNNELSAKFRFLGEWDSKGSPLYLEPESGVVSQALINYVEEVLPESTNITSTENDYFGENVQLNTELLEASEVFLTMVHEGADYKNTLGFYTYDINNPPAVVEDIDSLVVIFPNVSASHVVKPGDKVRLGDFPANTGIGYFLIANGWVGDTICLNSYIVFSDPHLNTFTSEEYRQHSILLNYKQDEQVLLGFEDIKRPRGDNDFNDAVFYITAAPNAIDTTDIPKIPTASISGDTTLCDINAPATLSIELSGKAPWDVVYNNGVEDIEISGITDNNYTFETTAKGTITLVSVKDKYKLGIADGEVNIELSHPKAAMSIDQVVCGGATGGNGLIVEFEGQSPFSLTYNVDGQKVNIGGISENQYEIIAENGQLIELLSMNDRNCEGTAEGTALIEIREVPKAKISGDATLCNGGPANIQIQLTGIAPFTFVFSDGENETTVTTSNNLYEFAVMNFGRYSLVSFNDAHCNGTVEGSATISDGSDDIQVEIDSKDNSCFGEEIALSLLGNTNNLDIKWTTEGNGTLNNLDKTNATYIPSKNETGTITFFAELANGCMVKTVAKAITIIEEIDASFSVSPNKDLMTNTQITFTPSNSSYDSYEWRFGDGNSSTATLSSTEYTTGGIYTVELIAKIGECTGEGSVDLEVVSKDELYVPNAFNPRAQNPENQVVKVYGTNVDETGFSFRIVNRWGKTMYETNSFSEANNIGWNGVNNNNDVQQELNVFTYLLKGRFIEGEQFERTGTVTQVK